MGPYNFTVYALWQNPNQVAEKERRCWEGGSKLLLKVVLGEASFGMHLTNAVQTWTPIIPHGREGRMTFWYSRVDKHRWTINKRCTLESGKESE